MILKSAQMRHVQSYILLVFTTVSYGYHVLYRLKLGSVKTSGDFIHDKPLMYKIFT
jgi:hypothetical protein